MRTSLLLSLGLSLLCCPPLMAAEWRPQVQDRGEALHGLVFSPDGHWALSSGNDAWASRYGSQAVFRLWSAQSHLCLWKKAILPASPSAQIMATPVAVLADFSCLVAWTEFRDNSEDSALERWLAAISPTGELLWKTKAPPGWPELSRDGGCVGFWIEPGSPPASGRLACVRLADQSHETRPVVDFPGALPGFPPPVSPQGASFRQLQPPGGKPVLVCEKDGRELWRQASVSDAPGFLCQIVPVENDPLHRWVGWSCGDLLRVLDTRDGSPVFTMPGMQEVPRLAFPGGEARELWLYTAPRKDASEENPSESTLAKLSLDGSSHVTPLPSEGRFCWPERDFLLQDRYLVCANFSGPQAVWCWDLATLGLAWFHEGIPGLIWTEGNLAFREGIVFVAWDDALNHVEAFRLTDGVPVSAEPPASLRDFQKTPPSASQRRHFSQPGVRLRDDTPETTEVLWPDGRTSLLQAHSIANGGRWAAVLTRDGQWNVSQVVSLETSRAVSLLVQRQEGRPPEWLAFDEDGLFEGSAGAGRLVAMTHGTAIHPIDQFAASLNRPDELLTRLGTASEEDTARMSQVLQQRRGSLPPSPGPGAPRAAILRHEATPQGLAHLSCQLSQGEAPLQSVQVYLNDMPVFGREGKPASSPGTLPLELPLSPGLNKIEVECRDAAGGISPRALCHLANPAPPVAGKLHFIGIGCSDYADETLPDLSFAHQDALDMGASFSQGKAEGTFVSKIAVNGDATRSGVLNALAAASEASQGDTLILFLAGHGCQHEGVYYYLPQDADTTHLATSAVSFEEIEEALFRCKARRKLLLLDTCASGQFAATAAPGQAALTTPARGPRARSLSGKRPPNADAYDSEKSWLGERFSDNDLFRRSGTVVLSSCAADQVSLEADEWQNGAFTEAFLKTLEAPEADLNGDGLLQKQEILLHCRGTVASLLAALGEPELSQTPVLDRDNLWEPLALPLRGHGSGKTLAFLLPENSLPLPSTQLIWKGALDASGLAHGHGELQSQAAVPMAWRGRMIHGRFEGPVIGKASQAAASESRAAWRRGVRVSDWVPVSKVDAPAPTMVLAFPPSPAPRPEAPPTVPPPRPVMARVGSAGYMKATNGALVWNNFPAADDVATWFGFVDADGFATGQGTLGWFKGRQFVTSYTGAMVRGRLEGETVSQDARGRQSRVWWREGKKVRK